MVNPRVAVNIQTPTEKRSSAFRRFFIDERKATRVIISLPLAYVIESSGRRIEGYVTSANLSGGGVRFTVPQMVACDSPCHINLKVPGHAEPLPMQGRVAWCRTAAPGRGAFEVGIAFILPREYYDATHAWYCRYIASLLLTKALGR